MFYKVKRSRIYHDLYYFIADLIPVLIGSVVVFAAAFVAGL